MFLLKINEESMKTILAFTLLLNGSLAFAHLDDRLVNEQVASHTKELTELALQTAKTLLGKKECEAGNNSPEEKATPSYKIQMIEGAFQGVTRFDPDIQMGIGTFLVLKSCPSGATQNYGDLTLEAGVLIKGAATFTAKNKLLSNKIDQIKEIDKSLIKALTELPLF